VASLNDLRLRSALRAAGRFGLRGARLLLLGLGLLLRGGLLLWLLRLPLSLSRLATRFAR
jgi:hypothetical protein